MNDVAAHIQQHFMQHFKLHQPTIRPITYGVINFNYLIETSDQKYLFKIYNLSDEKNLAFELSILDFLSTKRFPCPRIVSDRRQRLYHFFDAKPAVLLNYIPGRMITDITPDQMHRIGSGVGLLHRLLMDFRQPIERVTWEVVDMERHIQNRSAEIIQKNYPDAIEFVGFVAREFQKLDFPDNLPQGLTHQDVKPENIIIDNTGRISFVDFNDCYRGTLLVDVMTTIIWACFREDALDTDLLEAMCAAMPTNVLWHPQKGSISTPCFCFVCYGRPLSGRCASPPK